MKKITASILTGILCTSLAGCGVGGNAASASTASQAATAASQTQTAASSEAPAASAGASASYYVGINQLVQHPALDKATQGFKDELVKELGAADKQGDPGVYFDEQNAAGDSAQASTIANALVSEHVDLILANATASLIACQTATADIPILGTSITDYGTALGIDNFSGTVGGNISGTSDLAPLDKQADMFDELLPNAEKIGILYCSAEPNSVYQADQVKKDLEAKGKTVTVYTFADSNDVSSVTKNAVSENDALYIPTDNTAASCTEAIDNIARPAGVPIITGEAGIMSGCGIATLSIDYYNLGVTTGKMAAQILTGQADISTMPIQYDPDPVKMYDADRCAELGITVPDDYTAYTADAD